MKKLTKCENCGGRIVYSPAKKMLYCEHCDSVYNMPDVPKSVKLIRRYSLDYSPAINREEDTQYVCNSCKSAHSVEVGKVSTRCPSCGSKDIVKSSGGISPDGIIPFELNKEEASKIFEKWLTKRKLAPKDLFLMAKNRKLSSVYVPVYSISATCVSHYMATVKKVHTDSSTDTIYSTVHAIQDIETMPIKDYVQLANKVADKSLMEKIASVDMAQVVPYSSDYLFGYYGADTNVTIHEAVESIKRQSELASENMIRHKLKDKYDEIVHLNVESSLNGVTFSHLYIPVFMNHYTYKNKHYHCYISGTTGKVAGKSPKSASKILGIIGGALGIVGIIVAVCLLI